MANWIYAVIDYYLPLTFSALRHILGLPLNRFHVRHVRDNSLNSSSLLAIRVLHHNIAEIWSVSSHGNDECRPCGNHRRTHSGTLSWYKCERFHYIAINQRRLPQMANKIKYRILSVVCFCIALVLLSAQVSTENETYPSVLHIYWSVADQCYTKKRCGHERLAATWNRWNHFTRCTDPACKSQTDSKNESE